MDRGFDIENQVKNFAETTKAMEFAINLLRSMVIKRDRNGKELPFCHSISTEDGLILVKYNPKIPRPSQNGIFSYAHVDEHRGLFIAFFENPVTEILDLFGTSGGVAGIIKDEKGKKKSITPSLGFSINFSEPKVTAVIANNGKKEMEAVSNPSDGLNLSPELEFGLIQLINQVYLSLPSQSQN